SYLGLSGSFVNTWQVFSFSLICEMPSKATVNATMQNGFSGLFVQPLAPIPIGDFLGVYSILLNETTESNEDILIVMDAFACSYGYTWITNCGQPNSLHYNVVTAGTVAHIHIKGSRGCTLFLITMNVETGIMLTSKEQLL